MKNLTVLLFDTIYPQETGGMEVYNYHLAKHLLTDDYPNVIMLNSDPSNVDNKRVFLVKKKLFGFRRYGFGWLSIFISCLLSPHIKIRKWKTVLIPHTSNFQYEPWPVLLFSKIFGFKYVIHCHGGGVRDWKAPKLQKRYFLNASHATAVSQKIIDEFTKRTGREIEYLPPLMEYRKTTLTKKEIKDKYGVEFERVVLYVGSIKPLKAPETLLKAFSSLPESFVNNNNVGLIIAGDGPIRKELQSKYSDNSRILFLGAIKNEYVNELYAVADLYVICSWFEGTPLALMEAMYNGICCIGTRVQGIDAILQDGINGLLIEKDDEKKLSELILLALKDYPLAKKLGKNAYKYYTNHYSYSNHIKQVLDLLDYNK